MKFFKTVGWLCIAAIMFFFHESIHAGEPPPNRAQTSVAARGKEITGQAFALLSANLGKALAEGGVTNALSYCSVKALPLTKLVADTNEVRLSRVTHRPRNPANKANREEMALLKQFQSELKTGKPPTPLVVKNEDGAVTFFGPIILNNPLCLKCHGETGKDIAADNLAYIRSLYPNDRATGFKMGQLRGMWRVDFRAQPGE